MSKFCSSLTAFLWIAAIALQGEMLVMEMLQIHMKERQWNGTVLEQKAYILGVLLDIENL